MINISVGNIKVHKYTPFQLTNQTLYQMLNKNNTPHPNQSVYPIIKYEVSPQSKINLNHPPNKKTQKSKKKIHKKCQTEITHMRLNSQDDLKLQLQSKRSQKLLSQKTKRSRTEEKSTSSFMEKVIKINSMRLKRYHRNKFALGISHIQSINPSQSPTKKLLSDQSDSQLMKLPAAKVFKKKPFNHKIKINKRDHDNPTILRLKKQIQLLNLILNGYGCRNKINLKQLPQYSRNQDKYKFYVGPGNNRNLIREILRKRWYWSQTNSISQAHLIWLQLKNMSVISNLEKYSEESVKKPFIIIPEKQFRKQGMKLFHQASSPRGLYENEFTELQVPKLLHNHYEGNQHLGDKKGLFVNLSAYCRYKGINKYDLIPLTFHFYKNKINQFKKFEEEAKKHKGYWIVKPGQDSNQGQGIFVAKSVFEVKKSLKSICSESIIIQKYIEKVFLFNRRKFDIRTYFLAVTINGILKFFWYDEGYLRTSSELYTLNDFDALVHLTNDAIQVEGQKYSEYEIGNKISYKEFQRYLNQNYNEKYSVEHLHSEMKKMAKIVIKSIYNKINPSKCKYSFELFGLDFIIDNHFRPWLIEINTNPCLEVPAPNLERLIPQMMENVFRIAVDPLYPPFMVFPRTMSFCVPENMFQFNKFELIFDSFYDRDFDWEEYCK